MSDEDLKNADPGASLRQAREAFELTQRDVADALNLSVTTVDAIERGDKTQLPSFVFARGYVRAYGKLLELDADGLVAAFTLNYSHDEQVDDRLSEGTKHAVSGSMSTGASVGTARLAQLAQQPIVMAGAAAVVLLLILVIWLASGDDEGEPGAPEAVEQGEETMNEAEASRSSDDESSQSGSNRTASGVPSNSPSVSTTQIATLTPQEMAQAVRAQSGDGSVEVSALAAENEISLARLTPAGDDMLALSFGEDCWVEIKDLEGTVLYGSLGHAGSERDLIGAGPFHILLGYAPGVQLEFNGELVALGPHTRNNVASFVIGQ